MSSAKTSSFDTLAVHAGATPCPATGARDTPIYQSASYVFENTQHAADLFALRDVGFIYSRLTNPTVSALEQRIAALEGGTGATCAASGHAAQLMALSAILDHGDEFVASNRLYGGSINQFTKTFPRSFGWKANFATAEEPDSFKAAITERTKAIFIESLANPAGMVMDIEAIAHIADDAGIPLIVDNTMATPWLCRPFDFGANIICHSTTKFLSGHGNALGGAVVDGGNFDWMAYPEKFTAISQPDPGYRGLVFGETFGEAAFAVHNHAVGLRDLGGAQQPMNAYLTLTGMETLPLRMQRHCENAKKVAEFLNGHDKVTAVSYAGLADSPHNSNAQKYMRDGFGGAVFTFDLKGGFEAGIKMVEGVKLFSHLANIGDTKSLIIHPASTTHSQLNDERKIAAGAAPQTVRISVGIEDVTDIINDLSQAIESAHQ